MVDACLVTAAAFLVAALLLATVEAALAERRRRRRREALAAAAPLATLADPRAIFIALQIAQTVGFRRVAPLLAIGVTAFALGAARRDGAAAAPSNVAIVILLALPKRRQRIEFGD